MTTTDLHTSTSRTGRTYFSHRDRSGRFAARPTHATMLDKFWTDADGMTSHRDSMCPQSDPCGQFTAEADGWLCSVCVDVHSDHAAFLQVLAGFAPNAGTKTCNRCGEDRPVQKFPTTFDTSTGVRDRGPHCRQCPQDVAA